MSPRSKDLVPISSEFLLYTSPNGAGETCVGDEALARSSRAGLSAIMDETSVLAGTWPIASGKPSESRHFLSATVHEAVHDGVHEAAHTIKARATLEPLHEPSGGAA